MMLNYDSLLASRGAKQLGDLDLSSLANEVGVEEALLIANPALLLAALKGEKVQPNDQNQVDSSSSPLIK